MHNDIAWIWLKIKFAVRKIFDMASCIKPKGSKSHIQTTKGRHIGLEKWTLQIQHLKQFNWNYQIG